MLKAVFFGSYIFWQIKVSLSSSLDENFQKVFHKLCLMKRVKNESLWIWLLMTCNDVGCTKMKFRPKMQSFFLENQEIFDIFCEISKQISKQQS